MGSSNAFVGINAGYNTLGDNNSIVGSFAGLTNTTGSNNSFFGNAADAGANNLTFATAIGAGAGVPASNTIALGRANGSDRVRIFGLGTAETISLCLNLQNEISNCVPGAFTNPNDEQNNAPLAALRQQNL